MEGTCGPSVRAGTRASKDPRHGLLEAFAAAAGARATSSSEVISQPRAKRGIMVNRTIWALALIVMAPITLAATAGPKSFASPEAGIAALVEAVKVDDQPMLHGILGSHGSKLTSSGDAVADRQNRETFLKAYGEAHKLVLEGDTKATLVIGQDEWPMPIPLVKSDGGWRFDTQQGETRSASRPLAPYHGYFYRILTRQGKDAPGGAYDYFVNGKMIGGFAVIAYPARYGASGVMSFIVNHDGVVYEKDLGKNTAAIASKMTTFNPDASWKRP